MEEPTDREGDRTDGEGARDTNYLTKKDTFFQFSDMCSYTYSVIAYLLLSF